jgi:hypothetical protein
MVFCGDVFGRAEQEWLIRISCGVSGPPATAQYTAYKFTCARHATSATATWISAPVILLMTPRLS